MNFFRLVTSVLWVMPLAILCVIAVVMMCRRLVGQFPFFFIYTLLLPTRDTILYFLPRPGDRYSNVFWWGEAAAVLLALGIIFEISWHFVRPYPFLRLFLRVLWISAIVVGLAALATLMWTKGPAGADIALEWILLGERSARFLQVCLLIVAIAMMSRRCSAFASAVLLLPVRAVSISCPWAVIARYLQVACGCSRYTEALS